MKSVYKKVSVIALSSMIIAGGIASSGINAQAYDPSELRREIEDLGRGARVYYDVKYIAQSAGAKVEAVFSSNEKMNRYVEKHYWDRIQGHSESAKKEKKALLNGVDCGRDAMYLELQIKKHELGNLFRVKYKDLYFLIRIPEYKNLSEIPKVSGSEIERNLSPVNQRFYYGHVRGLVERYGYKVVNIYDRNNANKKKMDEYIEERLQDGVFKGDDVFIENLEVGMHCSGDSVFEDHLKHRFNGDVMRLIYSGMDILIVSNK